MHSSKCALKIFLLTIIAASAVYGQQAPELFTYAELVQLYETEKLPNDLHVKLDRLLTTPFVSNTASTRVVLPKTPKLGTFVRVVQWNIERGIEFDAIKAALSDANHLARLIDSSAHPRGSSDRKQILQQVALLKQADVIVLNEVDWGLKRTDYRNVASDLAAALRMNYAYGVEFVEVDPIALGTEEFEEVSDEDRAKLKTQITVDKSRYRGLHGTAIFSRFPLENVRLQPFEQQPHDWYKAERESIRPLEVNRVF
jgi:Endonuclease/Exonuclease/phosphatase family